MDAVERRKTAVHEAAHAVIHALGGGAVRSVCLHPRGPIAGECDVSHGPTYTYPMLWNGKLQTYTVGLAKFQGLLAQDPEPSMRLHYLRAQVCGIIAGMVSDHLFDGTPITAEGPHRERDDRSVATALCALLTNSLGAELDDEMARLLEVTDDALREPELWERVQRLADALMAEGLIADRLGEYLPAAREGWPSPC